MGEGRDFAEADWVLRRGLLGGDGFALRGLLLQVGVVGAADPQAGVFFSGAQGRARARAGPVAGVGDEALFGAVGADVADAVEQGGVGGDGDGAVAALPESAGLDKGPTQFPGLLG